MKKYVVLILIVFLTVFTQVVKGQTITGKVFNDANNNGSQDGAEVGYPYVVVNAYAPGAVTPTVTATTLGSPSASLGLYTLSGLSSGVKYRIEFITPTGYHDGAFAAIVGHSSIQFATTGATNVNYGIRYANECTIASNPRLVAGQCKNVTYPDPGGGLCTKIMELF
jgi:hypothetical protein